MGFGMHFEQMFRRASIRQGIMATLARQAWSLEVGKLRITHAALLTSLHTNGMVAFGGMVYENIFQRLETQQKNIAARRITEASRSARLAVLHMAADVVSAKNLFIQQCGLAIDRALRIHHSVASDVTAKWVRPLYAGHDWAPRWIPWNTADVSMPHRHYTDDMDCGREQESSPIPEPWCRRCKPFQFSAVMRTNISCPVPITQKQV